MSKSTSFKSNESLDSTTRNVQYSGMASVGTTGTSRSSSDIRHLTFRNVSISQALDFAKAGTYLRTEKGRKRHRCSQKASRFFFRVDPGGHILTWNNEQTACFCNGLRGKSKRQKQIFIAEIRRVEPSIVEDSSSSFLSESTSSKRTPKQALLCEFDVFTQRKQLKLIAESRDDAKRWVTALQYLSFYTRQPAMALQFKDFVANHFRISDLDENGLLSLKEIEALMNRINMPAPKKYVQKIFKEFDHDRSGSLDEIEFGRLLEKLTVKQVANSYFQRYASPEGTMSAQGYMQFLKEVQSEDPSEQEVRASFEKMNDPSVNEISGHLTEFGFSELLSSMGNDLFDPSRSRKVYQDMRRPFSEYWISTSHNTYLEADQFRGMASVAQYIRVLHQGCRCVEIDCWNGVDGEPVVTHGHTMVNQVQFRDVIRACRDHAFKHSEYPLILSLEMHCNAEQKGKCGLILRDIFGDMLVDNVEDEDRMCPEALKRRVLVKGKLHAFGSDRNSCAINYEENRDVSDDDFDKDEDDPTNNTNQTDSVKGNIMSMDNVNDSSSSRPSQASEKWAEDLEVFNQCICLEARKFKGIDDTSKRQFYNISSISEDKCEKLLRKKGQKVNLYHHLFLSRVYPSGTRVHSSNLDPCGPWLAGVQLVALNYQTFDMSTLLNYGVFKDNGCTGYVLKPSSVSPGCSTSDETSVSNDPAPKQNGLLSFGTQTGQALLSFGNQTGQALLSLGNMAPLRNTSNTNTATPSFESLKLEISLRIMSGYFLPKPFHEEEGEVIDPFVVIGISGAREDSFRAETTTVMDNGFDPEWDESFTIRIRRPEVAVLTVEVYDLDAVAGKEVRREFIGANACPVSGIREGVRWVPLLDQHFHYIEHAGLLVDLRLKKLVDTELLVDAPVNPNDFEMLHCGYEEPVTQPLKLLVPSRMIECTKSNTASRANSRRWDIDGGAGCTEELANDSSVRTPGAWLSENHYMIDGKDLVPLDTKKVSVLSDPEISKTSVSCNLSCDLTNAKSGQQSEVAHVCGPCSGSLN